MTDRAQNFWRKPLKVFAWFALLFVACFLVICCFALVTEKSARAPELIPFALVISLVLAVLITGGWILLCALSSWSAWYRLLFGIAGLLALLVLFYVEENWRGAYAWHSFQKEIAARGEKVSFKELIPPMVPDEKNFTLTPLLKPAMDFTQGPTGVVWRDTNALARLNGISADLSQAGRPNGRLVLGSLEKGTFLDLPACADFYRNNTNYPQAARTPSAAETVLVALGKFDGELKELREAAATLPYSRFPVQYEQEPSWAILLPHLARVKTLTILTYVRATAELEVVGVAGAFEELKLGLRLSDTLKEEPILIDHLVRIAALAIDLQTIREGLRRHAWTDAQLSELETYLAGINLLAEYKLVMRGERSFETAGLDYLRRQGSKVNPMDYLGNDQSGSAAHNAVLAYMPAGWLYQNMVTIGRMHQDFTLPAVDEQASRVLPEVSEKGDRALGQMRVGPYTIFAKMLLPALSRAVKKSARMQTYVDATGLACALERYRLANKKLPQSLDQLVPKFITRIPNDVIDGKPLRYLDNRDQGYMLYSVGWNKIDDGGEPGSTTDKKEADAAISQGDWVWQMPGP